MLMQQPAKRVAIDKEHNKSSTMHFMKEPFFIFLSFRLRVRDEAASAEALQKNIPKEWLIR